MQGYFYNISVALDQLLNALFFGFADETLSSRAYRLSLKGLWWRWHICKQAIDALALLFGDKDHCYVSFISERDGRQLPPECRGKL